MEGPRLIEQLRLAIRRRHYSPRTEKAYVYWARAYIRFHRLRHPREMGPEEIRVFLNHLAIEKQVASATQNQALAALLFLYREVLHTELPWLDGMERARAPVRLPVVLTREEVRAVLKALAGTSWLVAGLLYGAGLRVQECISLRVKDIDFRYRQILVRDGKGMKDRVTLLPENVRVPLERHLQNVKTVHERDVEAGFGRAWCRTPCTRPYARPASSSRRAVTPSVTASRRTCSNPATTSAPCRSSSVTAT
jgi:integrase